MTLWDSMARANKIFGPLPSISPNDTSLQKGLKFGANLDMTSSLPANPGSWNDTVESARNSVVNVAGANPEILAGVLGFYLGGPVGAAAGVGAGLTVRTIDNHTNGGASKLLQAGAKEVRSNYAFVRDVADKNAGMGFLAGLNIALGAVAGGVAGFAVAGPLGVLPGASLGAAAIGGAERRALASDVGKQISKDLNKSAKYASTRQGQEKYNFGNDVVHLAGHITGWETLGDNTKGIGAIISGFANFGLEAGVGPDMAAFKGLGIARTKFITRPITEPIHGFSKVFAGEGEVTRVAERQAQAIDMVKRTVAGEKTAMTPIFDFLQNTDPVTAARRPEFDSEIGQAGIHLFAGASREDLGLLYRVGYGDPTALNELAIKNAAKFAELSRLEDTMTYFEKDGIASFKFDGKTLVASKKFPDNRKLVEAEIDTLRKDVRWLDQALEMDSQLKDRTVSRWAYVEKIRNDFAKVATERKLAQPGVAPLETAVGKIYNTFYQKSPLSVPIRFIDRITDDAPKQLVNFNDPIIATTRLQSSLRQAEKYGATVPELNLKFANEYSRATLEVDKLNVIESYAAEGMRLLGKKYNLPGVLVEEIIQKYNNNHRLVKNEAAIAKDTKKGYMNDPQNPAGPVIGDPQLITQLANGAFLPDWKFVDKAFKEYKDRLGSTSQVPVVRKVIDGVDMAKDGVSWLADEANSMWRTGTLLRTGFPINVVRDSYIRGWGDLVLFDMLKNLGHDTTMALTKAEPTVARVRKLAGAMVNPNKNMKVITQGIKDREMVLESLDKQLKRAKYDPAKPPKKIPDNVLDAVEARKSIVQELAKLRATEANLVSGIKEPRVGSKKIKVNGVEFEGALEGRFGYIFRQKVSMNTDLRRALASTKELAISNEKRLRGNSRSVMPQEEQLHLQEWESILNNEIRFDPLAREILAGKSKRDGVEWLRKKENFNYLDRFTDSLRHAPEVYDRVKTYVDMYVTNPQVAKLILEDKLTILELKKLYPDIQTRPPVFTDAVKDGLGTSEFTRNIRGVTKDAVTWLATKPTSFLANNPYFAAKYEQELQSQIWLANAANRTLTKADKARFESNARAYALKEYREKINSFHRDMNYNGIVNYLMAFFPAVIEQFRAYGRITMENPEFIMKKLKVAALPEQVSTVEEDAFGNKTISVGLPMLGLDARLPLDWFNPDNPTGGNIVSLGPIGTVAFNEFVKQTNLENSVTQMLLPFGVQANSTNAMTFNTARRAGQLFAATFKMNGANQFNKDVDMFNKQLRVEYTKEYGIQPSDKYFASNITPRAERMSFQLAVLRFLSSMFLPLQPRYTTAISAYADILNKYNDKFGDQGEEQFIQDYPEYFLLADRLNDNTSGVRSDATSTELIRKNENVVQQIAASVGEKNISVLGAVFNDDNYAFSSSAQAYLQTKTIPGTNKKYKDVADAFQSSRSSIVSKGWNDFFAVETVVTDALKKAGINPLDKYGSTLISQWQDKYVAAQKTANQMWYNEYQAQSFGGAASRQAATVRALTIAVNNDNMWKDLSKNPRWHVITDYLNYRYEVKAQLDAMGTTIDSKRAAWLQDQVRSKVAQFKLQDTNFAKFYDRYFAKDKFDYVYEGE